MITILLSHLIILNLLNLIFFFSRSMDHVKIGDFGISKILSSKSKAFTVVGTPCYISPGYSLFQH